MARQIPASSEIDSLLRAWSAGREGAFCELLSAAYEQLLVIARVCIRREICEISENTFSTAALVGELYIRLAGARAANWKDGGHFYRICARTMHRILVDRARARQAAKRRFQLPAPLAANAAWSPSREEEMFDLRYALSRLERLDSRKARILKLRVCLGCTADETAEILNVSKATVNRDMKLCCQWLGRELRPEREPL